MFALNSFLIWEKCNFFLFREYFRFSESFFESENTNNLSIAQNNNIIELRNLELLN